MSGNYFQTPELYNHSIADFIGMRLKCAPDGTEHYIKTGIDGTEKTVMLLPSEWYPHKSHEQLYMALTIIRNMNYFVTIFMNKNFCSCEIWDSERKQRICLNKDEHVIFAIYNAVVNFIEHQKQLEAND